MENNNNQHEALFGLNELENEMYIIEYNSIHVFSKEPVNIPGREFLPISSGWHTLWETSAKIMNEKEARFISKISSFPVIYFSYFISNNSENVCEIRGIQLHLYEKGRKKAEIDNIYEEIKKNIYTIPRTLQIKELKKLSHILRCWNLELMIRLLEEYLGVALLINYEEKNPMMLFKRFRVNEYYSKYVKEEKRLMFEENEVELKLIEEYTGIASTDPDGFNGSFLNSYKLDKKYVLQHASEINSWKEGGIYVEYMSEDDEKNNIGHLMRVQKGKLVECTLEEWVQLDIALEENAPLLDTYYYFKNCGNADFEGKKLLKPHGLLPIGFDSYGYFYFRDDRYVIAYNSELKMVAILKFDGFYYGFHDRYFIVIDEKGKKESFDERNKIKIYEICKKNNNRNPK